MGVTVPTQYNPFGSSSSTKCQICSPGSRYGLTALTFKYNRNYQSTGNTYNQNGAYYGVYNGVSPSAGVEIRVSGIDADYGRYYLPSGQDVFTAIADRGFCAQTFLDITGGTSVTIHTGCSISLSVGDTFGPFTLVGFRDFTGRTEATVCNLGQPSNGCQSHPNGCCYGTNVVKITYSNGKNNCGSFNPFNPTHTLGCEATYFGSSIYHI